jgi:hypothetical protein
MREAGEPGTGLGRAAEHYARPGSPPGFRRRTISVPALAVAGVTSPARPTACFRLFGAEHLQPFGGLRRGAPLVWRP